MVDNDAGEDVLLQKIAEEIEAAAAQQENDVEDHEATEATDESSREFPVIWYKKFYLENISVTNSMKII